MLQAILHSKVGSQFTNLTEDTHWREVYSAHEDFLTAAIFGRLVYLDSDLLWKIIKKAVESKHKLPDEAGSLNDVKFWPTWRLPRDYKSPLGTTTREPDVVLEFHDIDLVIESKLEFSSQDFTQLAEEYLAHYNVNKNKNCIIVAIGGLKYDESSDIESLEIQSNEFIQKYLYDNNISPLRLIGCSWNKLNNAITEIQRSKRIINKYLYDDWRNVFKLHGIRLLCELQDIIHRIYSANLLEIGDDSFAILVKLRSNISKNIDVLKNQVDWMAHMAPFRIINSSSYNTLRGNKFNE